MGASIISMRSESSRKELFSQYVEPLGLVFLDILATYSSVYCAAWGTQAWMTLTEHTSGWIAVGTLALVNITVFAVFQMYSSLWRYASINEAMRIFEATIIGVSVGALLLTVSFTSGLSARSYIMVWALLFIQTASVRFLVRAAFGSQSWRFPIRRDNNLPKVLVVGAGQIGSLTIKRMLRGDDALRGNPVALVDDDPQKYRKRVHGVRVWGSTSNIPKIAAACDAKQIVLACPSATNAERQRIIDICLETGLQTLMIGESQEVAGRSSKRLALREVDVEDLLFRKQVKFDTDRMLYVKNETVLVTGGGGSIGSELVRQLINAKPRRIVIFDIYENTAYELLHDCRTKAIESGVALEVCIGSVTDRTALRNCMDEYRPAVVFHAAAHKHVPLMETNVREAILNNIFGTRIAAELAEEYECTHFILISTDKAVNPTNVMGATKRVCEFEILSRAENSHTKFAAVRFGNVLGSHGSVIPLFRRQLRNGGPITVTHPDITRYFMTIPEASRLVIAAGSMAKGGEVFVLKMGQPFKIYDLASNLIRLSGLRLGKDINIRISGLRPGEKLYEELQMSDERITESSNPDIMILHGNTPPRDVIENHLNRLRSNIDSGNTTLKNMIAGIVSTYTPDYSNGC